MGYTRLGIFSTYMVFGTHVVDMLTVRERVLGC